MVSDGWGNPSSIHASGRQAQELVESAREAVARWLGSRPGRIVFTSGATEANNACVQAWAHRSPARRQLALSALEHPSVQEPVRALGSRFQPHWLPVSAQGCVMLDGLASLEADRIAMLACMAANNETGALQPWREACAWGREASVPVHVDLTQVVGKEPLDLDACGADSASLSGHKLGALSGCGVLWSREAMAPLLRGGAQERDRRAGTENLAGILSLGAVAAYLHREAQTENARIRGFADRLREALKAMPGVELTVSAQASLPNTVHVRLPVDAEAVLIRLDMQGVCASMGSACSAGAVKASRTLEAMGWSVCESRRALRLSIGWSTTREEIDAAAGILGQILTNLASCGKTSS